MIVQGAIFGGFFGVVGLAGLVRAIACLETLINYSPSPTEKSLLQDQLRGRAASIDLFFFCTFHLSCCFDVAN